MWEKHTAHMARKVQMQEMDFLSTSYIPWVPEASLEHSSRVRLLRRHRPCLHMSSVAGEAHFESASRSLSMLKNATR